MVYQVRCTHSEGETKESGIGLYKKCQKVKSEKHSQSSSGKVRACCPGEAVRLCARRPRRVAFIVCLTLRPYGLQPTRLLCPWDFPGKKTGVGFCALLQRIFRTQGLNSVSYMAGRLVTISATREAQRFSSLRAAPPSGGGFWSPRLTGLMQRQQ